MALSWPNEALELGEHEEVLVADDLALGVDHDLGGVLLVLQGGGEGGGVGGVERSPRRRGVQCGVVEDDGGCDRLV